MNIKYKKLIHILILIFKMQADVDVQDAILKKLSTNETVDSTPLQKEFALTHEALYA